jgi:hypothetical protein
LLDGRLSFQQAIGASDALLSCLHGHAENLVLVPDEVGQKGFSDALQVALSFVG